MKLLFATGNSGKLREAREILGPHGIEVISPYDLGLTKEQVDVEETGGTFEENAVIKVQNLWRLTGMPCFADDSGLVVDALGGAPGIYSARYASLDGSGADHNFASNIDKLLHNLQGVTDRRARFVCIAALALPNAESGFATGSADIDTPVGGNASPCAESGFATGSADIDTPVGGNASPVANHDSAASPSLCVQVFEGRCEGHIAFAPAGCGGFGYDPVFIADAFPDRTLAEVDEDAKNAISHRGNALAKMLEYLKLDIL